MIESEWMASEDPQAMLAWAARINPRGTCGALVSDRKLRLLALAWWWDGYHRKGTTKRYHVHREWAGAWIDRGAIKEDVLALPATDPNPYPQEGPPTQEWNLFRYSPADSARSYLHPERGGAQAALLRDIIGNPFRPVTLPAGPSTTTRKCGCGRGNHKKRSETLGLNTCAVCDGRGVVDVPGPCPWLTPTVLSLAQAAYDERAERRIPCPRCDGTGFLDTARRPMTVPCPDCDDEGKVLRNDGTLDPVRLAVLSDALEEAGCMGHKEKPCFPCGGHGTVMQAAPDRGPAPKCSYCDGKGWREWPHPILAHLRSPGPHVRGCWVLDLILGKE